MNTLINELSQLDYTVDIVSLFKCLGVTVVLCIPMIISYHLRQIGYTRDNQLLIKEEYQEFFSVIIFGICSMFGNNFKIGLLFVIGGVISMIITHRQLKIIEKYTVQNQKYSV